MASTLANMFGKSPVQPLEQHSDIVCNCAEKLRIFFGAVIERNQERVHEIQLQIITLEEEADELKKAIRMQMPRGLFMPVARADLIELLLAQDRIANVARDVAAIVVERSLQVPAEIAERFMAFVDVNIEAARQARKSVRELDELYTVGFRGAEVELVLGMIEKLDVLERRANELQVALRAAVFAIENKLNPVDAVFLYDIIRLIGEMARMSERTGRHLEGLVA